MAPEDKDGFVDPAVVAAWRRMLWLVRGSADVVEALVPVAAGMTKDEISRLLARAGAPSGKGVEPVEQVLGLLGVVPRARYEALLGEHQELVKDYEELATRVGEAEENIERLRRGLREQGLVDEEEQLLDSWGGLVRRTLRAQAGLMRSIANAAGNASPSATTQGTPESEPAAAQVPGVEPAPAQAADDGPAPLPAPEGTSIEARSAEPEPGPPAPAARDAAPPRAAGAAGAARKRSSTRSRTAGTTSTTPKPKRAKRTG